MSSLVSNSEKSTFSGALVDLFDTNKRDIVVFKEARKVFGAINADFLPGYSDGSQEQNITYEPVSGVFLAQVLYNTAIDTQTMPETKLQTNDNFIRIKVERAARDYIKGGKTELVSVDGNKYNVVSEDGQQHFMGAVFYYFKLKGTQ